MCCGEDTTRGQLHCYIALLPKYLVISNHDTSRAALNLVNFPLANFFGPLC